MSNETAWTLSIWLVSKESPVKITGEDVLRFETEYDAWLRSNLVAAEFEYTTDTRTEYIRLDHIVRRSKTEGESSGSASVQPTWTRG